LKQIDGHVQLVPKFIELGSEICGLIESAVKNCPSPIRRLLCSMGPEGPSQVQLLVHLDIALGESRCEVAWGVNFQISRCVLDGIRPLLEPGFLAEIDLLSLANEANDERPPRQSRRDLHD
jgi:hypothetical protein